MFTSLRSLETPRFAGCRVNQVDVADTLVHIRDKLPAQIEAIRRDLGESGVKMERVALEMQNQLLEHRMCIEPKDAEVAAGLWEGLYASLARGTRSV